MTETKLFNWKKSFNLTVIFLIIPLLLISACRPRDGKSDGPYNGGIAGVSVSFEANAPPSRFDLGESVPVRVLLNNKGEFDLKPGEAEVQLFGVHRPSFGLNEAYIANKGDLPGISDFLESGGEQTSSLGSITYGQAIANSEKFTLKAKVCYPYETNSQIKACISSIDIEESRGDNVCSISGEKITKGSVSSSPVQITSFTEEFRGADKIIFNVVVENKGPGSVYAPLSTCVELDDPDLRLENENIILFTVTPSDIICRFSSQNSNSGEIKLKDMMANIVCQKDVVETDSGYEQNIIINLKYRYIDSSSTSFEIFERV
ncbi:hypothetical protein J4471_05320 [Candidatus Woesearchaeota archaeon]|nr:hypothetical protein [Candidatus Woesearchaeota archaeon]